MRYVPLLFALFFVGCDTGSPDPMPTPQKAWAGTYEGSATYTVYDGEERSEATGWTSTLRILVDSQQVDTLEFYYEGEQQWSRITYPNRPKRITQDSLVMVDRRIEFDDFSRRKTLRFTRREDDVSGVYKIVNIGTANKPDSTFVRVRLSEAK